MVKIIQALFIVFIIAIAIANAIRILFELSKVKLCPDHRGCKNAVVTTENVDAIVRRSVMHNFNDSGWDWDMFEFGEISDF